jgi:hypothetical protein
LRTWNTELGYRASKIVIIPLTPDPTTDSLSIALFSMREYGALTKPLGGDTISAG